MQGEAASAILWLAIVGALVFGFIRLSVRSEGGGPRNTSGPGPGASGAIYDMLNQDKRNAIEIIVEEKAGARDVEDKDGNLPDLEGPTK